MGKEDGSHMSTGSVSWQTRTSFSLSVEEVSTGGGGDVHRRKLRLRGLERRYSVSSVSSSGRWERIEGIEVEDAPLRRRSLR